MLGRVVRQRHWRNFGQGGETFFVTTTCLDFVHVFADPVHAGTMAASLAEDCRRTDSLLHGLVVMPHHVHFLVTPPEGTAITDLVRRVKANSARRIRPAFTEMTERRFDLQRGLNRHSFWQDSFRSLVVETPKVFRQKLDYIHENPVRSEIVQSEIDYRWSSFRLYEEGLVTGDNELDLEALIREFAPDGVPPVSRARAVKPR